MIRPLEGCRVALAEGRQLEELAQMLEKEGAIPLRCPMVNILDALDAVPIIAWLQDLIANRFQYVILMTGEALRRLLGFAERANVRDEVVAALGRTRTVTRGPKPVRALREVGLAPFKVAEMPTTEGVIATLQKEPLQGQTVGLTLYGDSNPVLSEALEKMGAGVRPVLPYIYAPAADSQRVAGLIEQMARGEIDVLIFTSSPQVDRIFEVAGQYQLETILRQGLEKVRVAAVGPVVAEALLQKGVRVDVCPEQGFVMKNLVQHIKRALENEIESPDPIKSEHWKN